MNLLFLAAQADTTHLFSFVEAIDTVQAIVLILGLILMVVELFAPGFGIAGGAGIVLLILGIVLTARNAYEVTVMVILLLILASIMVAWVVRSAKKGRLKKMVLWSSARKEDGYRSTDDRQDWEGREGKALTTLRPSGTADFDGERLDVVSEGAYIPAMAKVKIVRVEGRRIVVRPIQTTEEEPKPDTTQS